MRFVSTSIVGCFLVGIEPRSDERGFFARTHCEDELKAAGLVGRYSQTSVSFNARRGTVRGMHFSVGPHEETKLVRCTAGAIRDVLIDLRPGSSTYLRSEGFDLSGENRDGLYVPAGVAHGFQTLIGETEVLYMIDKPYVVDAARGVRWDDPVFGLRWPEPVTVISERDLAYPDWTA